VVGSAGAVIHFLCGAGGGGSCCCKIRQLQNPAAAKSGSCKIRQPQNPAAAKSGSCKLSRKSQSEQQNRALQNTIEQLQIAVTSPGLWTFFSTPKCKVTYGLANPAAASFYFAAAKSPAAAKSGSCKIRQLQNPAAAKSGSCKIRQLQNPAAAKSGSRKIRQLQNQAAAESGSCKVWGLQELDKCWIRHYQS
jgi:hypothetical protein